MKLFLILCCSLSVVWAQDKALMQAVLQQKEAEILAHFKAQKKSDAQISDAYVSLGERLTMNGAYQSAAWVYERALKRKGIKNPRLVMAALALTYLRLGDNKAGLQHVEQALAQMKKENATMQGPETARLYYLKVKLSGKLIAEVLSEDERRVLGHLSTYNQDLFVHEVLVALERHEFKRAFEMYGNKDIAQALPSEKVLYDFSRALGTKDPKAKYYCQEVKGSGYLAGLSLSEKACPLVMTLASNKKLGRESVNRFREALGHDAPEMAKLGHILSTLIE